MLVVAAQAQEAVESSRAKLAEEEAASTEAKRARAAAEGELARTKNQVTHHPHHIRGVAAFRVSILAE